MGVIQNKCYTIYSIIIDDTDIFSPSMPYTWKWATGKSGNKYPLGIFDNIKDAKIIQKLLLNTYPAVKYKAIPIIKIMDVTKLFLLINYFKIKTNTLYLESLFLNNKAKSYTINQTKHIFKNDLLA